VGRNVDLPRETLALVDNNLTKGERPQAMLNAVAQLLDKSCRESKRTSVN